MKAIAITPGTANIALVERPEPVITAPDQIKVKMLQVGICGTDREEAAGGRADPPAGSNELVIGHEMFGQVVEVGMGIEKVRPGDFGMFTVRRGCGKCEPCLYGRNDMCFTGDYTERGIKGYDGFQAQYVVDSQKYFVQIPSEIASIGVLTEPLSVAEKAIDEALAIQAARFPFKNITNWFKDKSVLVAGVGAVGLLAAFSLRLRGARVLGLDIVPEKSIRPTILKEIGGIYIDGRDIKITDIDEKYGQIDFIFEAAGISKLQFDLIDALGVNGIYVVTGIPAGTRQSCIPGDELMKQMVLKNQIVLGSVNAGIKHYDMAVHTLQEAKRTWGGVIERVITDKFGYAHFLDALTHHSPDSIKTVITW